MWRASFVLLRDELLEREAFDTLLEAKVLIERWQQHYNTIRPHSAIGCTVPLGAQCPWGADPRLPRRGSPERLPRRSRGNRIGLVCWRAKP